MPSQRRTRHAPAAGVLTGGEAEDDRNRIFSILRRAKLTMWAAEGPEGDFAIRLWTPGAESVYGYSKEEALGRSYIDLIVNPAERDQAIADHVRMVEHNEEYEWDWSADDVAKDGTTRTVLTNCFPIWDDDLQKHLLAEIAVDISRKEQAARKLRQIQAESIDKSHKAANMRGIAAVESMYSSIAKLTARDTLGVPVTAPAASAAVRSSVDGTPAVRLWLQGPDGPELAEGSDPVTRLAFDEVAAFEELAASPSPAPVFIDSSDHTATFAMRWFRDKAGRAGAAIPIVFPYEMRGVLAVHFSESRRITDSERAALGQLGLHLGVALKMEELSRERQRQRENDLLHARASALETALREVFHNVHGPVDAIGGGLKRIEDLVRSSAPTNEVLELIVKVREANGKVDAELQRFREAREHAQGVRVLELAGLCRAKARDFAHRFPTVTTKVDLADEVRVAAKGSLAHFLVSQAIEILFTNAAEAMIEVDGGGEIRVSVEPVGGEHLRLLFEDSGTGVPEELRSDIFRGRSTKQVTDGRRRGDGLPAARDGIASAGGVLQLSEVRSSLGGAVFTITFNTPLDS